MKRTHWLIDVIPPSEGDSFGEQVIGCGLDVADHISYDKEKVTCAKCLNEIRAEAKRKGGVK